MAANHTATHLLHYALRSRLGKDVTQAGSSVRADKFRFDFAYHEPIGTEHLKEIEELVNRRIVENHPVRTFTTSLEHARDLGAMALFGEKYDDFVRVVEIDDFSRELCGGTHVACTSEMGAFKILSEGSVGANVRRIEAVSGRAAVPTTGTATCWWAAAASSLGVTEDQLLPGSCQAAEPRDRSGERAVGLRLAGGQGRRQRSLASEAVRTRRGGRGGGQPWRRATWTICFPSSTRSGNAFSPAWWPSGPSCRARPRLWSASARK